MTDISFKEQLKKKPSIAGKMRAGNFTTTEAVTALPAFVKERSHRRRIASRAMTEREIAAKLIV